jgi:hypothetical protein
LFLLPGRRLGQQSIETRDQKGIQVLQGQPAGRSAAFLAADTVGYCQQGNAHFSFRRPLAQLFQEVAVLVSQPGQANIGGRP